MQRSHETSLLFCHPSRLGPVWRVIIQILYYGTFRTHIDRIATATIKKVEKRNNITFITRSRVSVICNNGTRYNQAI